MSERPATLWTSPVRYVECDQQGIVFNAHYLTWADEAVVPLFASLGTPYAVLAERGLEQVVVASELTWRSSARYGDVVSVDGRVERLGRSSLVLALTIRVENRHCCTVRTTYVHLGNDGRPIPIPADLRAAWLVGVPREPWFRGRRRPAPRRRRAGRASRPA